MRFWDREKEVKDLKAHIESEPNSILFVYGPKSSGKSTLLDHVIREIKEEKKNLFFKKYQIYWFDLRGKFVSNYESIIDLFFLEEDEYIDETVKEVETSAAEPILRSFRVNSKIYQKIKGRRRDPFEYMEDQIRKSKKKTVIVFDELQKLKDIYINGERKFVSELFNFFVRLTKVLHISHVIVMTSDTFFIEEVYTSSSLKNTSIYYLVDYFDDETAINILIEEGLSKEDAEYVVNMASGVPWIMAEVLSNGNPREKINNFYLQSKARLIDTLANAKKNKIYEKVESALKKALSRELDPINDREIIEELASKEILFYDPIKNEIKFQTRLDERAAKEILEKRHS